ncbi:TPA: restriction endonuclease [Bacillus thuringiensis]|uniref:restriction endonuclease n=1 Tax=Bacillus thuringiensis TaxID=1428 RepID=UPI0018CEA410|nr:restriction endonuclease [Bacillus thuringiensis]MBG9705735.1 restriction endonuclease [Bacillus thuringiensis]MEB9535096.1 restriction endonuclease [Bacillus cereus]MEB9726008.1 restriction endonuclease [Bacillus cereus]
MVSSLALRLKHNISSGDLSIYDAITVGDPNYWIPSNELEELLSAKLVGLSLDGLPLRTRSKIVKTEVCEALGYSAPSSFKKTQPRFLCQNFDVYTQKSNNLQIWNEEISPSRRYVLIKISEGDIITKVKVVTGDVLADLDKTGKLTQKYQARLMGILENVKSFSEFDTEEMGKIVSEYQGFNASTSPAAYPSFGEVMPIREVYQRLQSIVGKRFSYLGALQERNRGGVLHSLVCEALGYSTFREDGKFPDVKHQLVEVKLQTSPTIDLGLFLPNNEETLDIPLVNGQSIRMCDVRYAIFYGEVENEEVVITKFYLVTGKDFFEHFTQFGGKKVNKKLQIPLPNNFL